MFICGTMCTKVNRVLCFFYFNYVLFLVNPQSHKLQFFKHHYETIFERAEIINLNKSLADASASVLIYNRTSRPLSFKIQPMIDWPDDSVVFFRGFQFKSNEYRLTALQFAMHVRKAFQLDVGGFDKFLKEAVPPISWPLRKKVTYTVKNWLSDNQNMPFPYAPEGKWKDIISLYTDNKITKAFDFVLYYRIEDVPDI